MGSRGFFDDFGQIVAVKNPNLWEIDSILHI